MKPRSSEIGRSSYRIALKFDKQLGNSVINRPPNTDIMQFIDALNTLRIKLNTENKQVYSSDVYNINLLNTDKHSQVQKMLGHVSY